MRRSLRLWLKAFSFPEEILIEIFSRLPVKSLIRCKCLSKNWFNLISSPLFVKLQLDRANQNKPRVLFTSVSNERTDIRSLVYKTTCYEIDDYKLASLSNLNVRIIGSCNGLVCLSDNKTFVVICNPATKESVKVPFDLVNEQLPVGYTRRFRMGFGHDPVKDAYKVVRIDITFSHVSIDDALSPCEVHVLTLGTKKWRKITTAFRFCSTSGVAYVNRALHWLRLADYSRWTDKQETAASIISLDVVTEAFQELAELNHFSKFTYKKTSLSLGVVHGYLSTYIFNHGEGITDIWMMKTYGVKESWMKCFSIKPFRANPQPCIVQSVASTNDEIVRIPRGSSSEEGYLYAYDPINNTVEEFFHSSIDCTIDDCTYVESLVSDKSFSAEWLKESTNTSRGKKRKA